MGNIIKLTKNVYKISKAQLNLFLEEQIKNEYGDIEIVTGIEDDTDSTFYNITVQ